MRIYIYAPGGEVQHFTMTIPDASGTVVQRNG